MDLKSGFFLKIKYTVYLGCLKIYYMFCLTHSRN